MSASFFWNLKYYHEVITIFSLRFEGSPTTYGFLLLQIHLDKRVPTGAGLGGGSGNAATALWAANQLNGGLASEKELQEWSGEIGSDVPFFFSTGAAYCTSRGEVFHLTSQIFRSCTCSAILEIWCRLIIGLQICWKLVRREMNQEKGCSTICWTFQCLSGRLWRVFLLSHYRRLWYSWSHKKSVAQRMYIRLDNYVSPIARSCDIADILYFILSIGCCMKKLLDCSKQKSWRFTECRFPSDAVQEVWRL